MKIRVEFVYGDETRVLEKLSDTLTFNYSMGVGYKILYLINRSPSAGPVLEGYLDAVKRLNEVKVFCDGVELKHIRLSDLELPLYQCNVNEAGELKEYIEIQYQA